MHMPWSSSSSLVGYAGGGKHCGGNPTKSYFWSTGSWVSMMMVVLLLMNTSAPASASSLRQGSNSTSTKMWLSSWFNSWWSKAANTTFTANTTTVDCHMVRVDVSYLADDDAMNTSTTSDNMDQQPYVCLLENGHVYELGLAASVIQALDLLENPALRWLRWSRVRLDKEAARLILAPGLSQWSWMTPPSFDSLSVGGSGGGSRHLAKSMGFSNVLVLRVTYLGVAPTLTANDLAGSIFGLGTKPVSVNLVSQLRQCSFGQLQLKPAVTTDGSVQYGVAEISIKQAVTGDSSVRVLENAVVDAASARYGTLTKSFDHVIMVVPRHSDLLLGGQAYLAYGYLASYRTVFSDVWAGRVSALIHEVGHNFNLNHAGQGTQPYGDTSGYMGFGSTQVGGPANCYNAQKHWSLGWFRARSTLLTLSSLPWVGNLAAFTDYEKIVNNINYHVLLQVGQSNPRLFLQYNRAKSFNAGTRQYPDRVVIVSDQGTPSRSDGLQSWLQGGITGMTSNSADAKYSYPNYDGNGHALIIEVCEQNFLNPIDYVKLSIYLNNGKQKSTCNLPIETSFCDDNFNIPFFVDSQRGFLDCTWLGRNKDKWASTLCVPANDAYHICAETCGKCVDSCYDNPNAKFYVNKVQLVQNCQWLSTRPGWQQTLCVPGQDAYKYCLDSCNICG